MRMFTNTTRQAANPLEPLFVVLVALVQVGLIATILVDLVSTALA